MKYIKLFELFATRESMILEFNPYCATVIKTQWDDKIQHGLGLEKKPTAYHPSKGLKGEVHDYRVEWGFSLTNTSTDKRYFFQINGSSTGFYTDLSSVLTIDEKKIKWYFSIKNSYDETLEQKSFKTLEELISEVNRRFDKKSFIIEPFCYTTH